MRLRRVRICVAEVMSVMPTRMGSEHDASGAAPGAEAGEKDETGEKDQTTVASAQLPPRFIHFLRIRQPSIFWSLVLHLIFCQVTAARRVAFTVVRHA